LPAQAVIRERRPKPSKRYVIEAGSKRRPHERPTTGMICAVARRLQAVAPAVVWDAEFYLEVVGRRRRSSNT